MPITDEQLAKLPKYARWEIERLTANEKYAQQKQAEAEAGFMRRGEIVVNGRVISWLVSDTDLELTANSGTLVVRPRSSNVIMVRNEAW